MFDDEPVRVGSFPVAAIKRTVRKHFVFIQVAVKRLQTVSQYHD